MEIIKINNIILEFNKIIYVDAVSGNDKTGDGSKDSPFKTLQTAIDNSKEGNAIKLAEGIYNVEGFNNLIAVDSLSYIGNKKSIIELSTRHDLNKNPTVSFYKVIFRPSNNFMANKVLLYGGHTVKRTWNTLFYNCVFEDPFDRLIKNQRHSCYIMADGASGFEHNYESCKFINCVALDTPIFTTWSDSTVKTIEVKNCATNINSLISPNNESGHSRNVEVIKSLTNISFDADYNITSEDWQNTGTGLNPDGTQAHIGVYGGEFAWGIWLPQPIDNISYSTNQKSVGDTILISWGESDNATRYELQYYINNEWVAINNNITNTEYVYTFEQPNPTAWFRVRGVSEEGESEWAVGEIFEVTNRFSIDGEITINPHNKMRGYVDIVGYGESDLNSSLTVKQIYREELGSSLNISRKDEENEFDSSLVVAQRDFSTLDSSIALNPLGRMRGFVGIVQPPKKVKKIYPIKDSVVRQSAPTINYGDSQQMLAGENVEGKFISYLGFDLQIPDNIDIESIKLVLHKQYDTSRRFLMGLYETSDGWDEYDITWDFRPYDEEYVTQFPIPMEAGRVEADLTDFGWVEGKKSFIIRPRNYAFSELIAFGTRESLNIPYIEVTYYEIVENVNSYSMDSNITIRRSSNRDISANIDVQSDYVYSELKGLLEIEKKHNNEELDGTVLVAELRHVDLDGALEIEKKPQEIEISSSIVVPYRAFLESSIDIEGKDKENDLDSSIQIKAYDEEDLEGILNIVDKDKDSDLGSSIAIKRDNDEDLESSLIVENKHISEDLSSSIIVGRTESKYLDSTLLLERKDKDTNINSGITVQRKEDIDLDSSIEIPKYGGDTGIEGSLYVLHRSDIEGSIEVPKIDSQDEIDVSIEVPKYMNETSIDSFINVRVFWVDELDSFIDVDRKFEISGNLLIERKDKESELQVSIYVDVGGDYAFIM